MLSTCPFNSSIFRLRLRCHIHPCSIFGNLIGYRAVLEIDMVERISQRSKGLFAFSFLQFAFPHRNAMPAHACKLLLFSSVTLLVTCHLLHPKVGVGLRDDIITASFMSMPETAVHENTGPVLAQHDVRMPRQPWTVHPVTESAPPQIFPDNHLWLGVPAFDGCHVVVPLLP